MQRIKTNGGAGLLASPAFKFDDYFLPVGFAIICLAAGWGTNIYATQAMIMVIVAFCAFFLSIGDLRLSAIGAYLAIWYTVLLSAGLVAPAIIADSITTIGFGMIVYVLVRFGKTSREAYLNTIIAVAVVLSLLGMDGYYHGKAAVATLGNQNFLGAFLAISALASFTKRRRIWLAVILPGLWFCHSSTPIAAFCVGLGFLIWRWKGAALAVIPGAIYFFYIDGNNLLGNERLSFWLNAWDYISASPWTIIFGFGPGVPWNPGQGMLHSEWVNLVWNLGLFGLILGSAYLWKAIKSTDRMLIAMLLAVLIDGIGNHLLHTIPTMMLAIIIFALNDREGLCR